MMTIDTTSALGASDWFEQHEQRHEYQPRLSPGVRLAWGILGTVSMAASAYHGYKRNQSIGWALGWGFLGALFPVITPTIAVAQGFGKRKR
jgi:hypothetical protein